MSKYTEENITEFCKFVDSKIPYYRYKMAPTLAQIINPFTIQSSPTKEQVVMRILKDHREQIRGILTA